VEASGRRNSVLEHCPTARRVLFISYQFPPVGGAGVQRTVKFVKYLRRHGWEPSVLTVANPSVPAFDESLLADIPPDTLIRRARTLEPSYAIKTAVTAGCARGGIRGRLRQAVRGLLRRLTGILLQPDPQVLWMPAAVREGLRLLREVPHDAIVATGPPFSSFLTGAALSRRTGVPLVLDYRDEWDLSSAYLENRRPGFLSRYIQRRMQARVVRAASALVATTRSSARALEALRDRAGSDARVTWIYNGFDPDDLPNLRESRPKINSRSFMLTTFRLAYVGTLWNLTSVIPLVEAVEVQAQRDPALLGKLELVFAGRRLGLQQRAVERLKALPCRVEEHPYVEHTQAVELVRSADGLCALLSDLPGAGRVVPAKVFEYMATRKPVLVVAPHGELWDLAGDYPAAARFVPADVEGIAGWLASQLRGQRPSTAADWDGSHYDRESQAGELADLLNGLRRRPAGPKATLVTEVS
jgi:glycosyltransferase involved in cell wall biosynthesis